MVGATPGEEEAMVDQRQEAVNVAGQQGEVAQAGAAVSTSKSRTTNTKKGTGRAQEYQIKPDSLRHVVTQTIT